MAEEIDSGSGPGTNLMVHLGPQRRAYISLQQLQPLPFPLQLNQFSATPDQSFVPTLSPSSLVSSSDAFS